MKDIKQGEVGELVEWLRLTGEGRPRLSGEGCARLTRAADLLAQRHPAPVPVSERPWERLGWCDERGRCWAWAHEVNCWQLLNPIICADFVLLLPAHALPIPAGEVQP